MKKRVITLSSIALAVIFLGCGGGSSSNNNTKSLQGKVIDGPIDGASVFLRCNSSKIVGNIAKTDVSGSYAIGNIPNDTNLTLCTIYSDGGNDGEDLSRLKLKTDLSLYDKYDTVLITPITTMLSNNKNISTNPTLAKTQTANFLNISSSDLLKNPQDSLTLSKVSKILTRVALTQNTKGSLVGVIDTNSLQPNATLSSDVLNSFDIKTDKKENLKAIMQSILAAKNVDEVLKNSIISNTKVLLKEAYMLENMDNINVKNNISSLANKIAQANRVDTKYKEVSRYQIRKALNDINLMSKIDKNGKLDRNITNALQSSDFSQYLDKEINIKDVKGFVVYNSKYHQSVLGDDNDKRIEYYTFSDISHMAKALGLLENSYSDLLLNPAYAQIAKGYAKLGYDEEAQRILQENIYDQSSKIDTYIKLATISADQKRPSYAKKSLDKGFALLKTYFKQKGYANLNSDDSWRVLKFYYEYYDINEATLAEAVMDYFNNDVMPAFQNYTAYARMVIGFRNMIQEYIDEGNQEYAKILFKKAKDFVLKIPIEENNIRSITMLMFSIAHPGATLGLRDDVNELLAKVDSIDNTYGTAWGKLTAVGKPAVAWYAFSGDDVAGIRALNGETDLIYNTLKNVGIKGYSSSTAKYWDNEDGAVENGLAAALFIDGKKQEAIDLIYEYRPFKKYEDQPHSPGNQIFRIYAPRKISVSLDTGRQLKARDFNLMIEFYEMLVADMEQRPWRLSDLAIQKYVLNNKYGVTIVAKHYHDVNNPAKRDKMIDKAIKIADNMSDPLYKLNAYSAISNIVKELDLPKRENIVAMVKKISTLVLNVTLDNTAEDYNTKLEVGINQAKHLAYFGLLNESKTLALKLKNSLPAFISGNKKNIDIRVGYAIGKINKQGTDYYTASILSALVQAKEYKKAEMLIDEISSNVASLGESLDTYMYYRNVARAYAAINNDVKAKQTIEKIKTFKEKNDATLRVIEHLSDFDAFSNTPIAFVDFDGDGKPDFFNKTATKEQIKASNLQLDDDIDGDGILDNVDTLPYSKNN